MHKNFIFVSDHNAIAVFTNFLKKLVPEMKKILPDLKVVHYWSDSPSSQYQNKYIIDFVRHHTDIFGQVQDVITWSPVMGKDHVTILEV